LCCHIRLSIGLSPYLGNKFYKVAEAAVYNVR